jgi:hypothetical protein
MRYPGRLRDWFAVSLLLVLTILFFWRIALTNLILVGLDVFTYFYPYKAYAAEALRAGALPLWNPYLFMGVPFLANIQSATLYPLNLPLYWLQAPKMVSYSIVLHVFLGAGFTYLLARRTLRMGPWGACTSGVTLGLGGFLGAQVEHVNQLNVFIWLPLLLCLFHLSCTRRGFLYPLLTALAVGVQFLGGHIQASYINLFALGCYAVYLAVREVLRLERSRQRSRQMVLRSLAPLGLLVLVALAGAGLAAIQLVPTYELSNLSIREGGLVYRQAVSFSLPPRSLALSLLPSLEDSPFTEYIAYIGVVPLLLACLGAWRRWRQGQTSFFVALSILGLLLALGAYSPLYYPLYRLMPGFSFFRAPARWLYLYALGMAVLAGLGVEEVAFATAASEKVSPRPVLGRRVVWVGVLAVGVVFLALLLDLPSLRVTVTWLALGALGGAFVWWGLRRPRGMGYLTLLTALVTGELFVASRYLAYNRATAPEAFSSMRPAVAFLLTNQDAHRFLSFSDGSFDPGDLSDVEQMLSERLPEDAIYDYVVASKEKEILAPNLPLLYGLESIDGYDGGVLPLARYAELERLLLPREEVSVDGRLQGRIGEIPSGRILDLFNVRYVLTDKVYDVWVDGVYYDLGLRAILGRTESPALVLDDLPRFPSTALGVVSYLTGAGELEQGTPVAEITLKDGAGHSYAFALRAGEDTAEGEYDRGLSLRHEQARVVGHWRGNPSGNDYYALFEWGEATYPQQIVVRYLANEGQLRLRGMTLIDQRTGAHQSLAVSTDGRYRLVHSGDVKIYEKLDVLPRAFIVHEARQIQDDEAILAAMEDESFSPDSVVIVSGNVPVVEAASGAADDKVTLLSHQPERVTVQADLGSQGYLVLSDAYYPGWRALVDGQPAEVLRANLYFRAVYLKQGKHVVEFIYTPGSVRVGLAVTAVTIALLAGVAGWDQLRNGRSSC